MNNPTKPTTCVTPSLAPVLNRVMLTIIDGMNITAEINIVTIPDMTGNQISSLSACKTAQLAFTSCQLRPHESNISYPSPCLYSTCLLQLHCINNFAFRIIIVMRIALFAYCLLLLFPVIQDSGSDGLWRGGWNRLSGGYGCFFRWHRNSPLRVPGIRDVIIPGKIGMADAIILMDKLSEQQHGGV